jgi:ABC-type nitrate/sulfonate/bicarbonate transport system substrate-binding protein/outer membrane protein OmpA-like peptidoglycan-associated protein
MTNGGGKPKPMFFVVAGLVVLALVSLAVWRCQSKIEPSADGPKATASKEGEIDINKVRQEAQGDLAVEKVDNLTAKEFKEIPAEPLPEVTGASSYKKLDAKRTVRMAINIWAGWAPIIYANEGGAAKKVWKDASGKEFQLELVLIDDPTAMADKLAAGEIHIGWGTVDMLPLLVQRLKRDPRTMPRVFHQVDWSNGGDGIVVRSSIKEIADLRGKEIALAQNSPSHYFLLNMLLNAGVQPSEVNMRFYGDAFQAAQAFNQTPAISAAVTWAPDLYKLADAKGNKLLITTQTANKLIGDVWFARADFARDEMDILEGLVRGFLDAQIALADPDEAKAQAEKTKAGAWMDELYGFPKGESYGMLGDAHWTNYAENKDFFLNANNPANFERTYNTAYLLYRAARIVEGKIAPEDIADPSIIKKLESEPKYANQKNEYDYKFTPVSGIEVNVEASVLTKRVVIEFCPNKSDPLHVDEASGKECDPNAPATLEEIAKLAAQYGRAHIQIEGHTDSSMKNEGKGVEFENNVRKLSQDRAAAVKQALVNSYKSLSPDQFVTAGFGWDRPGDPDDPMNQRKNRRVEVKVIPVEAQ